MRHGTLSYVQTGTLRFLANTHLSLWTSDDERHNKVLLYVIGLLIFQFGFIRAAAAMDQSARWSDAIVTYCIEGAAVTVAAIEGKTQACSSMTVLALCLGCVGVLVAANMYL